MSEPEGAEKLSPSPLPAGERLRAAREAQGLPLTDIAERTRVPLRHLEAIEAGDYEALPAPAYATGFSRAYARAVGMDEVGIARDVRAESARLGRRQPEYEPYVTADPARLPSRGLAIVTAGVALAVIVLAALWLGTGWLHGGATQPAAPVVGPVTAAAPTPAAASSTTPRQVTLTANDTIWLRVYDAANKTLFLGTMKPGDKFDVPPGADHPKINVGRADKLAVTLDGKPVPALGTGERPIKDVPVDAASIAARTGGAVAPVAGGAGPASIASGTQGAHGTAHQPPRHTAHRDAGDETQRANRSSERAAVRGEPLPIPATAPSDAAHP